MPRPRVHHHEEHPSFDREPVMTWCSTCNESGYVRVVDDPPACGGFVWTRLCEPTDPGAMKCPKCHGTGSHEEDDETDTSEGDE